MVKARKFPEISFFKVDFTLKEYYDEGEEVRKMSLTLKAARVNLGLSRKEAAAQIGISPETLGNYERGQSYPAIPVLKSIERVYGVAYNDLIFCSKITLKE